MTDDFTGNPMEELAGLKARFAKEKKGFRQAKYGVLEEVSTPERFYSGWPE